jgi:hypothetical protein
MARYLHTGFGKVKVYMTVMQELCSAVIIRTFLLFQLLEVVQVLRVDERKRQLSLNDYQATPNMRWLLIPQVALGKIMIFAAVTNEIDQPIFYATWLCAWLTGGPVGGVSSQL